MDRTRDASCACLLACSPAAETAAPCVGLPRLGRPPASAPANELHATAQTLWRASLSNPALGLQCRMCHCQQPPVGRCSQARWLVAATDAGRRPRPWMTRSGCGRSPSAVPQRRPLPQAPNARCRCEALLQLAGWLAGHAGGAARSCLYLSLCVFRSLGHCPSGCLLRRCDMLRRNIAVRSTYVDGERALSVPCPAV